jgi:hypothetical protein
MGVAAEVRSEDCSPRECITLPIKSLRRDGGTQARASINADVVEEYAELMLEGIEFPPVRAHFDGTSYWLADGFHRVAAAERLKRETIWVRISHGTLADAQWDSYCANALHGLRRTPDDMRLIVARALHHERAQRLSNRELGRHLYVSERTIRRIRERLSAATAADTRIGTRNGREYEIHTANIGKPQRDASGAKNLEVRATIDRRLAADVLVMDREASPEVRRILRIFANWTQGAPEPLAVLQALENLIAELKGSRVSLGQASLRGRQ